MHADLERRAIVSTAAMPWTARDGFEEKLLEESTMRGWRRTSIVRLPPGGQCAMAAGGSVDLLVLAGGVRIDGRTLAAGTFRHEPAGKTLTTTDGATAFVKQRPASRVSRRTLDLAGVVFEPGMSPGLARAPLHADLDGDVVLLRFSPGTTVEHHHHERGEEFFVLDGSVQDEAGTYGVHDWVRQPDDSTHRDEPGWMLVLHVRASPVTRRRRSSSRAERLVGGARVTGGAISASSCVAEATEVELRAHGRSSRA